MIFRFIQGRITSAKYFHSTYLKESVSGVTLCFNNIHLNTQWYKAHTKFHEPLSSNLVQVWEFVILWCWSDLPYNVRCHISPISRFNGLYIIGRRRRTCSYFCEMCWRIFWVLPVLQAQINNVHQTCQVFCEVKVQFLHTSQTNW